MKKELIDNIEWLSATINEYRDQENESKMSEFDMITLTGSFKLKKNCKLDELKGLQKEINSYKKRLENIGYSLSSEFLTNNILKIKIESI
jgi:hypothetical protein